MRSESRRQEEESERTGSVCLSACLSVVTSQSESPPNIDIVEEMGDGKGGRGWGG